MGGLLDLRASRSPSLLLASPSLLLASEKQQTLVAAEEEQRAGPKEGRQAGG